MSWLKKVGQFLASGVAIAANWYPLLTPIAGLLGGVVGKKVAAEIPAVGNDLTALQAVVVNVESIYAATEQPGVKTGVQKLQAALPFVKAVLLNSEIVAGHKIANETLFNSAVQGYLQATVDLCNSFKAGDNPQNALKAGEPVGGTIPPQA